MTGAGTDSATSEDGKEPADSPSRSNSELVVATSYVPEEQYAKWKSEAEERDVSISILISSMVELGINDVKEANDRPTEINDLRKKLAEARKERDKARKRLRQHEDQEYTTGLGRIKDLIIENPGINRREIANYLVENTQIFVNNYLNELESGNYYCENNQWFPPNEVDNRP